MLDESTDRSDTAELVIFITGIDENFNIIEEMLDLYQIKGTTKGKDMYLLICHQINSILIEKTFICINNSYVLKS